MNTYSYTKAINSDQLTAEIRKSDITAALDHIETVGLQVNITFKTDLTEGEVLLLNGIVQNHVIQMNLNETRVVNANGIPLVEMALRKGTPGTVNFTIVSPDFSDRTNWYQKSVEIKDETLTTEDSLTFSSSHPHWININSPKLTVDYKKVLERDGTLTGVSKRTVIVKVDSVTQVEGQHYDVNYALGKVTFKGPVTGQVKASYWHNDGIANCSEFLLVPPAGFMYRIHHIECQFSQDSQFPKPIVVEIWAGAVSANAAGKAQVNIPGYMGFIDPAFDAGYGQSRSIYRGLPDLINWCTNSYPTIPACGELEKDIMCFPFKYIVHPEISSQTGAMIRVVNKDDAPMVAEISTVTFYMEKVPV